MGRAAREITDAELSVLNELWQRPSATVQELTESLYGNTAPALLATVRKLLDRLEAEGCVSRDREKWPHHYFAILKRGLVGTFHHVGEQHLSRYVKEFDFRYNFRTALGVSDVERTDYALKGISGKRLTYRRTGYHAQA